MNKLSKCIAEAIGTFALIFIGIGAINANPGLLGVALAHGLTIAVMVSATGHISGGHLNPAVTLGALVGNKIDFNGAISYWVSQLIGATAAAFVCLMLLVARWSSPARRNLVSTPARWRASSLKQLLRSSSCSSCTARPSIRARRRSADSPSA